MPPTFTLYSPPQPALPCPGLLRSIYVHQDKPQLAMSALDQAVSSNFAVRETPLFHIVNAKVCFMLSWWMQALVLTRVLNYRIKL